MKRHLAWVLALCCAPALSEIVVVPAPNGDVAAPLNAAIAACSNTSGCEITIAPFTSLPVLLGSVVIINKPNVKIRCATPYPMATTYQNPPLNEAFGYFYGVFDIAAADNTEISGCGFDVSSLGVTGVNTIHIFGSKNVLVRDNLIKTSVAPTFPATLGIRAEGTAAKPSRNVEIRSNTITVQSIGLSVGDNAQHISFHDNTVIKSYQCFDFNGSAGRPGPSSFDIDFYANVCRENVASGFVESASNVRIHGNTFWNEGTAGDAAIRVHNTLTPDFHLQVDITDNLFVGSATTTTYAAHFFQNINHWTFSHNRVRNMRLDGLLVDSTSGTPSYGEIVGNQFVDNGQAGASGQYCGIRLLQSAGNTVAFLSVSTNQFVDDQGSPTQDFPLCSEGPPPFFIRYSDNQSYLPNPISLPAGCNGCVIEN